jgi:hypothetical protein
MPLPVIAITNQSTVLTDEQVKAVIPSLQKQVSDDFKGYWNVDCSLSFLPKDQPLTAGWWQIVVLDDPDQAGALGYHELSSVGTPLGKIFAKLDQQVGSAWTVTLSHELLEMLGDPWIDTVKQVEDGRFYALEVSDAVEADNLGYLIDNVLVSDFVTPKWFNDQVECDRYSFKEHVTHPLELATGGYISVFDGKNWGQVSNWSNYGVGASGVVAAQTFAAQKINLGSRRDRRTMPKKWWKQSAR